jgi:carbamoyltransferase
MKGERIVVGINRTSDASVCLLGSEGLMYSTQKERLSREKHDWGAVGDFREHYARRIPALAEPVELVVECYSSDAETKNLLEYRLELREVLKFGGEPRLVQISHHLAHVYSTFYLSPFEDAAVMVLDFQGSRVADVTEAFPAQAGATPEWVEVGSFYKCDARGVVCVAKQLWNEDRARPVGLGCFYTYLTGPLFPGQGNEGKVMGLAPYGDPDALGLPPLDVVGEKVFIPDAWRNVLRDRCRFSYFQDGHGSFEECANLAAAGQRCFEEALLKVAGRLQEQTGARNLCFSGGTALNCVANGRLLRESKFERVFVPPSPHDGGTALGCAVYGLRECLHVERDLRWINDFTGLEPSFDGVAALLARDDELNAERPRDLIAEMVELLAGGKVVALFQGRSELGPRALGHRSILADPRRAEARPWINEHVKGRESFRPLAPAALEEDAHRYFDIVCPIPFMQFAVDVRPEARALLPAVTHVDGTARLQTVSRHDDEFFHALLTAFKAQTGVGVLLNTSFNGRGEPIVETPAEAVECFKATALDALAMPPYLIRKRSAVAGRQVTPAAGESVTASER